MDARGSYEGADGGRGVSTEWADSVAATQAEVLRVKTVGLGVEDEVCREE